jgi:predicted ribosome quality control (RQC) complex YloA/Tae2 family protein
MPQRAGFFEYIKRAFVNHWNLLAVGAGVIGGALSGHADIALPVVAALEMTYLAGLASNAKFQSYVDAQAHKASKVETEEQIVGPALGRMFAAIDPASRARFEALRRRCRELRKLSDDIRPGTSNLDTVEQMQTEGINKLLWAFLKLLYSRHAVARFLATTNEQQIRQQLHELEHKLAALGDELEDTTNQARIRRTLADTLASVKLRVDNLTKAKQNFEFLELEIDRIDNKITSIAELAVNRQDPDFITSEVDGVAASMEQTEAAINDLQLLDIEDTDAPPPSFLDESYSA